MKVSAYVFLLCCTVAVPAFAADPPACDDGGADMAWLFDGSPGGAVAPAGTAVPAAGSDLLPPLPIELASGGGNAPAGTCTVTEDCDELPDISCSGTVCSAVSRNCSGSSCQRGSVTCNGVTTQCSQVCPPNCTLFQCRQGCKQPGCTSICLDLCTCECEPVCQ